jgi:LuxR family transcriptional regulator
MASWREEWLQRLTAPGISEAQVFEELAKIMAGIGFEYCSLGIRLPVFANVPKELWFTTYPESWQSHYLGHNYMAIDPVIGAALGGIVPVVWTDALFKKQRGFWEEARGHRVRHGWTVAMRGRHGETGLLSLARSESAVSVAELDDVEPKLVWLAQAANGAITNLISRETAPALAQELKEREREVLRWTAVGKTSSEIGMILGISTRTVNFHVTAILAKLNAVNKTQAVIKAMMFDLL